MNRIALVTGGTRGIGGAISMRLQEQGYTVAANYGGNEEAARAFAEHTGIGTYKFDVADMEQVSAGVKRIGDELGAIEILVNNAGITRDGTMHRMTFERWQAVLQTNLTSCFNCSRAVIEGMRQRNFGRIVNISSINAESGQFGQVNYSAAKAGMFGFTKALALESAAKNITVNTIAPGYIETDMVKAVAEDVLAKIVANIPVGRIGQVEDVARAVLFLVDDNASFITGSTLDVNGGQYLR